MSKSLTYLRIMSLIEGLSTIALMCYAMPMKYKFDQPEIVSLWGRVHGGLFVALILMILWLLIGEQVSKRNAILTAILSSVPFGCIVAEILLKKEQQQRAEAFVSEEDHAQVDAP